MDEMDEFLEIVGEDVPEDPQETVSANGTIFLNRILWDAFRLGGIDE